MSNVCFECGAPAEHNHHVVPKVLGGNKTVPLCTKCHGLVHDRNFTRLKELQKKGIAKGGGWNEFEEDISIEKDINYTNPTNWLGFRCVCDKVK